MASECLIDSAVLFDSHSLCGYDVLLSAVTKVLIDIVIKASIIFRVIIKLTQAEFIIIIIIIIIIFFFFLFIYFFKIFLNTPGSKDPGG